MKNVFIIHNLIIILIFLKYLINVKVDLDHSHYIIVLSIPCLPC